MDLLTRLLKISVRTLLIVATLLWCHLSEAASSLSDAVSGLKVDQVSSFNEMKAALTLLHSYCVKAKNGERFTFEFQKLVLSKAGECVSKTVALEQHNDFTLDKKREELRGLFLQNSEVIQTVLHYNQAKVVDMQEHRLDQLEDTDAFFNSPEWQQPQYLISLASYWQSWNGYYSSLFYHESEPYRKDVLEDAVEGFSRTYIDFEEELIVVRSLFGRALCYKEMRQYERAIRDMNTIIGKIKRDDALYVRSRYERVLISYLIGNYEATIKQLSGFRAEVGGAHIPDIMDSELKKLRVKAMLALAEKDEKKQGKDIEGYYRDILNELKNLAEGDERQIGELYRFVNEHSNALEALPFSELGSVGYLAIADVYFNQQKYDRATPYYQRLYTSSDRLIKRRKDDVYFRLGYCYCQNGQWQNALPCFEALFTQFPRSDLAGKAACAYYVAASNQYRENDTKSTYAQYLEATKKYLKLCSDSEDKSNAHYRLGKYYQERGKSSQAFKEFSQVGRDSPNYPEARYNLIQINIDKLESFDRRGLAQSKSGEKLCRDALRELEEYQKLIDTQEKSGGANELKAHVTLLKAKLSLYGPERNYRNALTLLKDYEQDYPAQKELYLLVKSLRIECYLRLQMCSEAKKELNSIIQKGVIDRDRWSFLSKCASMFYEESNRIRGQGNDSLAGQYAEVALMVYNTLYSLAQKDASFKRYYDPIKIRIAELYLDDSQLQDAKALYLEMLNRDPLSADAMFNLGLIYEREEQWEKALATWRKFSKGLKPGTYYWFESRYHSAKVLHQQGNKKDACELMTVVQVLHPELRDEEFKRKFFKLQREIPCSQVEVLDISE